MSGTLIIRENATWMPTGWVFDTVLENLEAELKTTDASLTASLCKARMSGYIDLSQVDTERFHTLLRVTERAYSHEIEKESSLPSNSTDYFTLMFCFSQFRALLRTDPRIEDRLDTPNKIVVSDNMVWVAPRWVFDMMLEHFEAYVRTADQSLAAYLITPRTSEGLGECNLRSLDEHQFRILLPAAEWVYAHYGDGKGRLSRAPAFFSELAPYVVELHALLKADPRAVNMD